MARLHQVASAWYARVGLIDDALRHALAAGDESVAAELLISQFHAMLDQQLPAPTLMRWLALFPPATIQAQPGLLFAQLCLSAFGIGPATPSARLADIEAMIQQDPKLIAERRQALLADLALLRGIFAYWNGEPQQAILLLQGVLEQRLLAHLFGRAQALMHLALAYTCTGEIAVGHRLLHTALIEETAQQRPTQVILLGGLAILHLHAGELTEAVYAATQAVAAVEDSKGHAAWQGIGFVDMWHGWAHYLLGMTRYEQNDLATATHHWQRVETMRYRTNPSVYQGSLLGLALIAQANGAPSQALAYAQAARAFAAEIRRPQLLALSAAFEVRLALHNGQTADALRQTQTIDTAANQGMAIGVELPPLTRLCALLAVGTPAALTEALAFVALCLRNAENTHNTRQVIQLGALQALILHGLRRTEEAFDVLARTLTLGETGGFVRTFLDLGAPLADLLRLFGAARGPAPSVKRLLAAFPQTHDPAERRALATHYAKHHGITPLTSRELELMALIRQRLSIDEIAATLVISPNTVKKHANNIYTKLGVRNRREALIKAEELSLLPLA